MLSQVAIYFITAGLGVVAGFFIGCVGVGGIILVPALIQMDIDLDVAIATVLFSYIFAGIAGTSAFLYNSKIAWPQVLWLVLGAIPGAAAAPFALIVIPDLYVKLFLYSVILITSIFSTIQSTKEYRQDRRSRRQAASSESTDNQESTEEHDASQATPDLHTGSIPNREDVDGPRMNGYEAQQPSKTQSQTDRHVNRSTSIDNEAINERSIDNSTHIDSAPQHQKASSDRQDPPEHVNQLQHQMHQRNQSPDSHAPSQTPMLRDAVLDGHIVNDDALGPDLQPKSTASDTLQQPVGTGNNASHPSSNLSNGHGRFHYAAQSTDAVIIHRTPRDHAEILELALVPEIQPYRSAPDLLQHDKTATLDHTEFSHAQRSHDAQQELESEETPSRDLTHSQRRRRRRERLFQPEPPPSTRDQIKRFIIGLLVGFCSALTGSSGPVLLLPIILSMGWQVFIALGCAQVIQIPIAGAAVLSYVIGRPGYIDFGLGATLAVTLVPSLLFGVYVAHHVNAITLKLVVSAVMVGAGVVLFGQLVITEVA
eukprot:m.91171 g.91171  ORF g.91171 m.91171 type:complete len:539 (+) comp14619_c0_seq4:296-1912(+)